MQDVGELDLGVLRVVKWGCKVVVGDFVGDKLGPFAGDDDVEGSGFFRGRERRF